VARANVATRAGWCARWNRLCRPDRDHGSTKIWYACQRGSRCRGNLLDNRAVGKGKGGRVRGRRRRVVSATTMGPLESVDGGGVAPRRGDETAPGLASVWLSRGTRRYGGSVALERSPEGGIRAQLDLACGARRCSV
jgi:hypothetical protein